MRENFVTLSELLSTHASRRPDKPAFVFLDENAVEVLSITYQELDQQSRALAAALQSQLKSSTPIVLALDTCPQLVVTFFGCIYAGMLPVILPPPRHKRDTQSVRRIERALAITKAQRLYVTPEHFATMSNLFPACDVRNVEQGIVEPSDPGIPPSISGATAAYLQFTSGSTARPRGIVLTHENVLANLELIRRVFQHDQDLVTVSWLPLHHDMGLVGHVLQPLFVGGTSVLLPPVAFVRDPLCWLRTISRYRAVSSGAPPFAYDLCAQRRGKLHETLDLSCWKNAYAGAEPISPEILRDFAAAYAQFGFNESSFLPCYGLAEATLFVAGARADNGLRLWSNNGAARQLVGYSCAGAGVRIVDPETHESRANGEVGEIWLTGASIAQEYFGDERATTRTFARENGERYLRTGDLGFVVDEHLYVTGRLKDLIIVRGVNYYPEDIEETVRATRDFCRHHAAVSFSVPGRASEDLIILQEVKPAAVTDAREYFDAVREAVAQEHGLQVASIVVVRAGSLPRTSSGKISRRACRNAYVNGKLREVAAWRNSDVDKMVQTRVEQLAHEPIAIIGMACRFPGAESCDEYWSLLRTGGDAITEVPRHRWNVDLFYDPRPAIPGKMNTRWGGFLNGIDRFDAEFFGITPPQATEMDPQQRLVLEVAWRAFENAGLSIEKLNGSGTGVFVGLSTNDYMHLQIKLKPDLNDYNAYSGLGNANSLSANLLSYTFNLRGPSVAVDTACSSSLTSVHLAARSLRNGECEIAIAGGVNTLLSPGTTVTLSQFNMMSPEGRCKVFDSGADGYVRSEGCGLVVLKRRSDALRDGDNIIAYLLGSAIGQNGRTTVITAPNAAAQQEVIQKALGDAGCRPEEITFVEAHGTGTVVGDPAEVEELKSAYGRSSSAGICYLGSVKANVGHLEAAAGIAGFIKLILCLKHGEVPPQIHLNKLNPRISLGDSRLVIPNTATRWATTGARMGAVSSFGFGGANAHAIVAANEETNAAAETGPTPVLFPLSARTETAWRDQARAWVQYLRRPESQSLPLLAYSQSVRRSHFKYRHSYVAATREELAAQLESSLESQPRSPASGNHKIGFLFSGQGSQYAGMGEELYERFSIFRKNFDRCAAVFAAECPGESSLKSIVFSRDSDKLENTLYLQPALFAVEYALAKLLIAVAGEPSLVLGHSLGEYVAACIAGCAEPEDLMRLVITRARLMSSIKRPGAMLATTASETDLGALLESGDLCIAALNAPNNTVISGPADQAAAIMPVLLERGFAARLLRTSQAFHSSLMDEVLDEFETAAAQCRFSAPRIPLISNVHGDELRHAPDAAYWRKHLRSTVLFNKGLGAASRNGINACFEVGPGSVLLSLARQTRATPVLLPVLDGRGNEVSTLLRSLGELYCQGSQLHWTELFDNKNSTYVPDLPGHPYYRKRYWFASQNGEAFKSTATSEELTHTAPRSIATYKHDWIKTEPEPVAAIKSDDHFILVGGSPTLAAAIADELRRAKAKVFTIVFTEHKRGANRFSGQFSLPLGCDAATYAEVLREITSRHSRAGASRWNVLYLHGLDCAPATETSVASLERDQRFFAVGDLTAAVQALIPLAPAIRLWIVTANCQPVSVNGDDRCREPINLAQSTLWGFAHTLFLERSEMRGGVIDLDAADDPDVQAAQVLAQISRRDETVAAFRAGESYAPRLTPATLNTGDQLALQRDGVYLITGGLGGLGLKCAEWMAQRGAGEIVLVGRTGLPDRAEWDNLPEGSEHASKVNTIRAIERMGAKVKIFAADVSDHARMSEIIDEVDQLRGVVHAAGVNWFSKIADLDRERLLETLKIKVSAAWNLHQLTEHQKLDFFILFSSVSALWGSVDLAHYTAANQFLDALAYERRRQGRHALAINWGPWSEVGMSAKTTETHLLTMLGFRLLSPEQALASMEALLVTNQTRAVVADIDWERFRVFVEFSSYPKLFETVWNRESSGHATMPRGSEADRIRTLPSAEARARLVELLQQQFASILLLEPGREVDVDQRFNLMGMDSLMAITFALRLETLLHVALPSALVYNYPTIREAADYLFEVIRDEKVIESSEPEREAKPAVTSPPSNTRLWFPYLNGHRGASVRLFCFPYAGSGASIYRHWQELLRPAIEVVPVQLPGREDRASEPALREMQELASSFVNALRDLPATPFALFGHSMGALICFAVMCELRRLGMELPRRLFVSACVAPNQEQPGIHHLPDAEFKQTLVTKFDLPREAVVSERVWSSIQPTLRCDINLLESHKLKDAPPLDVPMTVFGGANDPVATRGRLLDWSAFTTTDFSLRLFSGNHMYIKQHESQVIEILQRELAGN